MNIELLNTSEKDILFKRYLKGDFKTTSYMNILLNLNRKNDKKIKKIQEKADPRKDKKSASFYASLIMHNTIDVKRLSKHFGKPEKTREFGEFGTDVDALYFFIFKIKNKYIFLTVDDRGTSCEIENMKEEEFIEIYEVLLNTLKKVNKKELEFYNK